MTLDGTVRCWGEDGNNQGSDPFGTYTRLSSGYNHACGILTTEEVSCWGTANNWVAAPPAGPWESVTSGDEFACALRANGTASCWNGVTAPGDEFTQIDAGGGHACGVRTNGTLLCWGDNSHGQVSPAPTGSTWYSVSAGDTHTCAVDGDDWSVTCWGNSANGQLVAPGGTYDQVDAGWNHTCAVRNNGQVACWGCAGADEGQCSP
jgi:alpha-tubulin suppressor-like RCC1 family protein